LVRPAILVVNGRGPKPLPGETVSTTTTVCRIGRALLEALTRARV